MRPELVRRAASRADEVDAVEQLVFAHRGADIPIDCARHWAHAVALGCLGDAHLWEDLGLASRAELGRLMQRVFPSLVRLNAQGMRWKKFLYRQLCIAEDVLVCRSPSCDTCDERAVCFAPETPGSALHEPDAGRP